MFCYPILLWNVRGGHFVVSIDISKVCSEFFVAIFTALVRLEPLTVFPVFLANFPIKALKQAKVSNFLEMLKRHLYEEWSSLKNDKIL
jgi:hypothetical protein